MAIARPRMLYQLNGNTTNLGDVTPDVEYFINNEFGSSDLPGVQSVTDNPFVHEVTLAASSITMRTLIFRVSNGSWQTVVHPVDQDLGYVGYILDDIYLLVWGPEPDMLFGISGEPLGGLRDVAIFDVALSPEEIAAIEAEIAVANLTMDFFDNWPNWPMQPPARLGGASWSIPTAGVAASATIPSNGIAASRVPGGDLS